MSVFPPIIPMGSQSARAPLSVSYDCGPTDTPLIELTIGEAFDRAVELYPDNDALICIHQGIRWTYRQLQEKVNQLASAMIRDDLRVGDRVGIWSHNNAEWVLMQLATAKAGLVLVNINPAYRLFELEYALNKVGCKTLVMMRRFKTSDYVKMLQELAPEISHRSEEYLNLMKLPALRHVAWINEPDTDERIVGMQRFSKWLASGDPNDPKVAERMAELHNSDAINIQFTSGTTGAPKGATLTHRNIINNGFFIGEAMRLTPKDRMCIPVPLYHCFGMVLGNLAALTHGACIIYPDEGFDPEKVLQTVEDEKCTALHGVPTMFIGELAHPRFKEFDLSTLRTGIMAGSSCPIEVMKQVNKEMHLDEITIAYGMTETSPVSCQSNANTPIEKRVSTVGLVQPHIEVKIVDDETGDTLPIGETGELLTRGYSVMQGYWDSRTQTREAIDEEGWMHTGDLAVMDEEGYVKIVGRIKDMVIRGGENIYPTEIESFLYRHRSVQDVQVVGIPDERMGEVLCAWIILHPGKTATEEEILEFCRGNIAHYKVPQYIRFVDAYPMTVSGKVQKFKIVEDMINELGLQ